MPMVYHEPKQILIVHDGLFEKEQYNTFVDMLKEHLRDVEQPKEKPDDEPKKEAVVEVVESEEGAVAKAKEKHIDTVIFISVAMLNAARRLRSQFPRLTVLVLAGRSAEGEPYLIPKQLLNSAAIEQLIKVATL